jgi:alkylhydroperoxidase/carboxymuconolactone decarboxylase family protein YurZ
MADSERFKKGEAVLQRLFGGVPPVGALQEDFRTLTIENLFGDVWNRPGLEISERSMITVTALTVLGREKELKLHLRGALNLGIPQQKLEEMMIHLAHYGGWPVGVAGLRAIKEVLAERAEQKADVFDALKGN